MSFKTVRRVALLGALAISTASCAGDPVTTSPSGQSLFTPQFGGNWNGTAVLSNVGPVVNGYAFCDIEKQKSIAKSALKWTIDHPYTALLNPEIPALPGDRRDNFRKAFNELMDELAKEEAYLDAMPNVESIKKQRRENGADVKYCWRN